MNNRTDLLMSTYKPQLTIVVYQSSGENDFYLESHRIDDDGRVMEGKPLLQETVQSMVDLFFDERQNSIRVTGFIPENVLSFGQLPGGNYRMIWWNQPQVRVIRFAKQLKIATGRAWMPALLYVVDKKSLAVFAIKDDDRPKMNSRLFRAPFHNVSDTGSVCLGSANVKKPTEKSYTALMKYWEDLFWLSEFSHLNGASNPTNTDLGKVWRRMVAKNPRRKWSDIDEMKPLKNLTINSLMK